MSAKTDPWRRPKAASPGPLRALGPFLAPYKGLLALSIIFLLLASTAMLSLPIAARYLVDNGFANSDLATVNRYFAGFFLVAVLFGVFAALRFYFVTWLGERVVADLRNAVYRRVIHMDPTFFELTRTGEVLSRLTADTTLVQTVAGSTLSITLRSLINLVGGLTLLAITSFKLTLFIFLGIPMVLIPLLWVGRRIRGLSRTAQDAIADTSGVAGETLNAIQTVQAYTLEELQIKRFSQAVAQSFKTGMRRIRMRSILTAMGFVLVFGAITVILWMGSRAVINGEMTMGQLAQFLLYSMLVGGSAAALSEQWGAIQLGAGAMERLCELLETFPAILPPPHPRSLGRTGPRAHSL